MRVTSGGRLEVIYWLVVERKDIRGWSVENNKDIVSSHNTREVKHGLLKEMIGPRD